MHDLISICPVSGACQIKSCYSKCSKISYTKVNDKMAYANTVDPDQKEQSDQDLHCLYLKNQFNAKKSME